jgi:tape measure domain-containing protein
VSFIGGSSGPIASAFVEVTAHTEGALASILGLVRALGSIDDEARRVGEGIERAFKEAANSADRSLRSIGGADAFGRLEAESKVAGDAVGENVSEGSGRASAALSFLKTGALLVGGALATGATAAVGFGLKTAASLEQTQVSFKALLGSAEEADKFIRQMQEFAATTPFEFAGLANNAKSLLATAGALKITRDQIIPTISTVGDLTAVLGAPPEAIDRVILAFSQMASKGKASTEELLQIGEALPGFPVFEAMAKGLGITTQELQKQVSDGLIPADKAVQALLKGMKEFPGAAGAMAAQSQTLLGLFSTFKDTISLALTDAFLPLVDQVKTLLTPLTTVIGDTLKLVAPAISDIAQSLLAALIPIINVLGPAIADFFRGFGEGIRELQPAIEPLAAGVGAIFKALGQVIPPLVHALEPFLEIIARLVEVLLPPLAKIIGTVVKALTPFLDAVAGVAIQLIEVLAPVIERIADAFATTLGPAITQVAEILGGALLEILKRLSPVLVEIIGLFADEFIVIMEAIAPVLPELATALAALAIAFADLVIAVLPIIPPLLQLTTIFVRDIGAPVLLAIATALSFIVTAFANLLSFLAPVASPLALIATAFQLIHDKLGPIADTITNVFKPVWDDLRLNVIQPVHDLIAFNLIPRLVDLRDFVFGGIAAVITNVLKPAWDDFRINTLEPFIGLLETRGNSALTQAKNILHDTSTEITNTLKPAIDDLRINVWDPIVNTWNTSVVPALTNLKNELHNVWIVITSELSPVVKDLMNNVFLPLAAVISSVIAPSFLSLANTIKNNHDVISNLMIPITFALQLTLFGLRNAADGVSAAADFLAFNIRFASSVFQTLGDVAHALGGALEFVEGIVHSVGQAFGIVAGMINNAIGKVNNFIATLNSIPHISLPSFPSIPGFAGGGIIDKDTFAVLHSPEVVIPLDDRRRAAALAAKSGLLDLISQPSSVSSNGTTGSSATVAAATQAVLGGITIENVHVQFAGAVSNAEAQAAADAFTDSVEATLRRRALTLTVRTI